VIAEIAAPPQALQSAFESVPEIAHFDISMADGEFFRCALTPQDEVDIRSVVASMACQNGWQLRELTRSRHSLEDIYVQVTKPRTEDQE